MVFVHGVESQSKRCVGVAERAADFDFAEQLEEYENERVRGANRECGAGAGKCIIQLLICKYEAKI